MDKPAETLSQAVTLIRQGQKDQARTILIALLKADPRNEITWLWLVETLPNAAQRIAALEQCLKIIPESLAARKGLERLKATAVAKPVEEASPPPTAARRVAPEVEIKNGTARPDSQPGGSKLPAACFHAQGKKSPGGQASPVDVTGGDWLDCSPGYRDLGSRWSNHLGSLDSPGLYHLRRHLLMSD